MVVNSCAVDWGLESSACGPTCGLGLCLWLNLKLEQNTAALAQCASPRFTSETPVSIISACSGVLLPNMPAGLFAQPSLTCVTTRQQRISHISSFMNFKHLFCCMCVPCDFCVCVCVFVCVCFVSIKKRVYRVCKPCTVCI